jgi:putative oxidoreductase
MIQLAAKNVAFVIARSLLVATFVIRALKHLTHWTAALDEMTRLGMPRSGFLMAGSIVLRLAGGLSVLAGIRGRWGAALLLAVVLPATFLGHAYWTMPLTKQPHEIVEFLNNLSMSGGVLFVLIAGTSPAITWNAVNRAQGVASWANSQSDL